MFCSSFALCGGVPVYYVLHCSFIAEEDTIVCIGICSSGAIFGFLRGDFGTKCEESVQSWCAASPFTVWCVFKCGVVGSVIEPDTMKKCVTPEFNAKSSRVEEAAYTIFEGFMGSFCKTVLA